MEWNKSLRCFFLFSVFFFLKYFIFFLEMFQILVISLPQQWSIVVPPASCSAEELTFFTYFHCYMEAYPPLLQHYYGQAAPWREEGVVQGPEAGCGRAFSLGAQSLGHQQPSRCQDGPPAPTLESTAVALQQMAPLQHGTAAGSWGSAVGAGRFARCAELIWMYVRERFSRGAVL